MFKSSTDCMIIANYFLCEIHVIKSYADGCDCCKNGFCSLRIREKKRLFFFPPQHQKRSRNLWVKILNLGLFRQPKEYIASDFFK